MELQEKLAMQKAKRCKYELFSKVIGLIGMWCAIVTCSLRVLSELLVNAFTYGNADTVAKTTLISEWPFIAALIAVGYLIRYTHRKKEDSNEL